MAIKIKNFKKGVDKVSGKMYNSSCVVESKAERKARRKAQQKQTGP